MNEILKYTTRPAYHKWMTPDIFAISVAFLLGVSLPISNSFMNIALGLIAVCLLFRCNVNRIPVLLKQPLIWLPLMMFSWLAISLVYTSHDYGLSMVLKYKKLLWVVPLALFFLTYPDAVKNVMSGFLLANGIILLFSIAAVVLPFSVMGIDPDNPVVFKGHITQNFFMVLAIMVWVGQAFENRRSSRSRILHLFLVVLAIGNVLLMVQGRTGYIALGAGIGALILCKLHWWQRFCLVLIGGMLFLGLINFNNQATKRLQQGAEEIVLCLNASGTNRYSLCDTSMGQRTEFVLTAWELIKTSPVIGHGAGGFWFENPKSGYSINNPHNEYLLQMVQGGVIGLIFLLGWLLNFYCKIRYMPESYQKTITAFLSCYLVGNVFNSFLLDSSEGHFFIVLTAIVVASCTINSQRLNA